LSLALWLGCGCNNVNGNGSGWRVDQLEPAPADLGIRLGREGDQWLDGMAFKRVARATRDGVFGYDATYATDDFPEFTLFWPREAIHLHGESPIFLFRPLEFETGRVLYPTVVTRRSLQNVWIAIQIIEDEYARQAAGGTAAAEGFIVVITAASLTPALVPASPLSRATVVVRPNAAATARSSAGSARVGARKTARAAAAKGSTNTAAKASTSAANVMKSEASSSRILGRSLEAAGHTRPPGSAAHHIVAGNAERAEPARRILQEFGIGINDAANGVFLPATGKSPNAMGAAVHASLHSNRYYTTVNKMLGQAQTRDQALGILARIRRMLLEGGI
jgi:hypothetical protein